MAQPPDLAASLAGPAGAPVLVLGNSLGTTGEVWEPQAAALGERFRLHPQGYAGCCEAIAAMDQRSSLGRISAPTLVIAGAEDPATPPWHGARIASAIGRSRLRVIRGGSHMANVSQPGEVTAALLAHLTGPPGA
jgi:pimeloyl-ACP methyl ester carboxylesterase